MALTDKLTAIGDAIREKTGIVTKIPLDNMPARIRSISTGSASNDTSDIDQGVVDEANRVANSILGKIKSNSITFIAMADMHEFGDSDHTNQNIINLYRLANKHAGQGAKLIARQVPLDFFVNLGDLAWGAYSGSKTTTPYDLFLSVEAAKSYLDITNMVESIMLPGNHDTGLNLVDSSGNLISDDYAMATIGSHRLIDFDNKKVRVIALNTAERANTSASASVGNMSNVQLEWFANSLDLSTKSDVADWKILILSHHPFGSKYISSATDVLEAYVNGSSITVNSTVYNFSGKNSAKVIGNFHGHTHCFKVANIKGTNEISVKRIAIPNACAGRNNEYGRDAKDYEYGEEVTCPTSRTDGRKSETPGQDTAFCVVTIDLDEEVIYADCFGGLGDTTHGTHAGFDRIIEYGVKESVYFNVYYSLTNAISSNRTSVVEEGSRYVASITAETGYNIEKITVTMGENDVTSQYVANNIIDIPEVTGDIIITATTVANGQDSTYTNLVPTAIADETGAIFNSPYGYKDGYYLSSSNPNLFTQDSENKCVATGSIHIGNNVNDIYVKGATWDTTNNHVRFMAGASVGGIGYTTYANGGGDNPLGQLMTLTTLGDNYYKFSFTEFGKPLLRGKYYRFSLVGNGADLVITHDEPITEGGEVQPTERSITYNLTKVSSNNTITKVDNGYNYTATLTADSGYEISSINVTMGGNDVTSQYVNGNVISIPAVTGNIVITATASEIVLAYTNLVPTLLDLSDPTSGTIFNGCGYMDGKYISTASPYYNTDTERVTTGFLPYTSSTQKPIYIKGVTFGNASHDRIGYHDSKYAGVRSAPNCGDTQFTSCFYVTSLGDKYFKITPNVASIIDSKFPRMTHVAFSFVGNGDDLIITIDEPIE